jgi:hypothetical protein
MTPHECMPLYELHKFKELSSWVNLRQQRSRNTMNFLLIMFHSHNGFTPGSSPILLASIKHTLYAIPHCMFSAKLSNYKFRALLFSIHKSTDECTQ